MTKQEIKALVLAKIAGQGTQVDLGGALPTILDAIVDAIPEGGASPVAPEPAISIKGSSLQDEPFEDAAAYLGISVEELHSLPNQSVVGIKSGGYVLTRTFYRNLNNTVSAVFGSNLNVDIDYDMNTVTVVFEE